MLKKVSIKKNYKKKVRRYWAWQTKAACLGSNVFLSNGMDGMPFNPKCFEK
jgi:hypothetical protein